MGIGRRSNKCRTVVGNWRRDAQHRPQHVADSDDPQQVTIVTDHWQTVDVCALHGQSRPDQLYIGLNGGARGRIMSCTV